MHRGSQQYRGCHAIRSTVVIRETSKHWLPMRTPSKKPGRVSINTASHGEQYISSPRNRFCYLHVSYTNEIRDFDSLGCLAILVETASGRFGGFRRPQFRFWPYLHLCSRMVKDGRLQKRIVTQRFLDLTFRGHKRTFGPIKQVCPP